MKNLVRTTALVLVSFAMLTLTACKKDDDAASRPSTIPGTHNRPERPSSPEQHDSYLVQVLDSAFYSSPEQLGEAIGQNPMLEMTDRMGPQLSSTARNLISLMSRINSMKLDTLFDERIGRDSQGQRQWGFSSYAFSYRTIAIDGSPIVLSARITFPNNTIDSLTHELSSLSLWGHMMLMDSSWAPSVSIGPMAMRSFFNSAVIEPDFQGYGIDKKTHHCGLAARTLGRQFIDCGMAALELLRRNNVILADDGYTDIWSVSMMSIAVLGAARYYEMEAPAEVKRALRYRSAFCVEGPIYPKGSILYASTHPNFRSPLTQYISNFEAMYIPHPGDQYTAYDFCADWMQTTMVPYGDTAVPFNYYIINKLGRNSRNYTPEGYIGSSCAWNFASDMLDENGQFDMSSPKTQAFFRVFDEQCQWETWVPQHPLYLGHCVTDDFIPHEPARELFDLLHAASPSNLHWYDVPDAGIKMSVSPEGNSSGSSTSHFVISILGMMYCTTVRNPEDMVKYYTLTE